MIHDWAVCMHASKLVTDAALLLKKRAPRFYLLIRDAAPKRLRAAVNEKLIANSLGADAREVFTNVYRKNWWNNGESRSGWGSELRKTEAIRTALPDFVARHGIGSLLDAPCGDFHWMRHVQWPTSFRYVGGDIVGDLIADNRRAYPDVEFMTVDVLHDPLPAVDAWLARDLMIHFPDSAVWAALEQFRRSSIGFLLATTYPNMPRNTDIRFGQVRHLNLCTPPFNLPPPREVLREDDNPQTGRVVGVWRREDVRLPG